MADTDQRLRESLLAEIPEDGHAIGNTALMRTLGWSKDQYWSVRGALLEEGTVERARGKGGSVRRVVTANVEGGATEKVDEEVLEEAALSYQREFELYEPMRDVIADDWAKDRHSDPLAVEITARQGRRQTGGRWSRPDIVSVDVKTYRYVPGKYIELVTFEVKPFDSIDVSAVYEALAHYRSATQSYVVFHVPDDKADELEDAIEEVRQVARFHGIGVIGAADPGDFETWTEYEEAQRHEPDPARLDSFISTQLAQRTMDRIAQRLR